MKLVVIESPYAGDVALNEKYARACMKDCLKRGEFPIASHLLYTQPGILDDTIPEERALGVAAGFAWADKADYVVFYMDRGWSLGMIAAYQRYRKNGPPVRFCYIGSDWESEV